jgi:arylsulfatase A-like enzyme
VSVVAAVFFFSLLRTLLAGYGGLWFFPGILGEAVNASLAFFLIAVADGALRRFSRMPVSRTEAVMRTVEYVALFAYFGKAWIEPHAALADSLSIDARLSLPLVAIGGGVGLLATRLERRAGRAASEALLWTVTGWLIVGPWLFALLDDIESPQRIATTALIGLSFAALAAALASVGRLIGEQRLRLFFGGCVASVLAVALLIPGYEGTADSDSILLIMVESFRADALDRRKPDGAWLMPRARELAERGVRFTQAVSPAPWSLPSTISALSGMNPHRHYCGRIRAGTAVPCDRGASYIGGVLRQRGYQSAGFVNTGQLRPYYGIGDDFLTYRRYHGDAHDGTALMLSWIQRHRARPFFAFLNLSDPRWPYAAPARYDLERDEECTQCDDREFLMSNVPAEQIRREVRRRYDSELAFTDLEIGRLFDEMKKRGLLDRLWIFLTGSHGEEFWEHGSLGNGISLYDEVLRVPLLVVPPLGRHEFRRGTSVASQVRLEDIAPSVLELADIQSAPPRRLDGTSLMRLVLEGSDDLRRPSVSGYLSRDEDRKYAIRDSGGKLIVSAGKDGTREYYDLKNDPGEIIDLSSERSKQMMALEGIPFDLGLVLPQAER